MLVLYSCYVTSVYDKRTRRITRRPVRRLGRVGRYLCFQPYVASKQIKTCHDVDILDKVSRIICEHGISYRGIMYVVFICFLRTASSIYTMVRICLGSQKRIQLLTYQLFLFYIIKLIFKPINYKPVGQQALQREGMLELTSIVGRNLLSKKKPTSSSGLLKAIYVINIDE